MSIESTLENQTETTSGAVAKSVEYRLRVREIRSSVPSRVKLMTL